MKNLVNKINSRFLLILSGLLLGFTIIFADIGALSYFALIPLAYAIFKRLDEGEYNVKRAYLDGFIFYMSLDVVGFHWFVYFYPLDYVGLSNAEAILIIILAWIGLSALQSAFSALVFVAISQFAKTLVYKKYPILLAPFAACLFAINEWTQTLTWAGIPWTRIAISQTEMPIMMQSASLFGSYFLTFIVVAFNFLFAFAIFKTDLRELAAISALVILLGNIVVGAVLYFIPQVDKEREIRVASVQPNIDWKSIYALIDAADVYDDLTRRAASDGAEMVIWPEGAFPVDINDHVKSSKYESYVAIKDFVTDLAKELGITIVLGSFVDGENASHNSMSAFYPDGETVIGAYNKMRPVPFGEYVPMKKLIYSLMPTLAEINLFGYQVNVGESATVFSSKNDENALKVGTLICFDAIYDKIGIESARAGAEMFIIPSNDQWFYDSRALNMHHSQNVLRAVEQGKYTVNCANSGISSIINNKGEVVADMPIYKEGYVIDTVYASNGRTLYSCIGNLFVYLCIVLVIAPFMLDIYYKRKNK